MSDIKKKKHEQYIKQIYRLIGFYLAEKLQNTSITANHITLSRILLILLSSVFILSENYLLHFIAAFLIIIFSMFDALDGSLATLKNEFSLLGTWLDPQIDRVSFLLLFLTLAFHLSKEGEFYIYLTMYVLVIFYMRGLLSSDLRLKDKFILLREEKKNETIFKSNNERKKEKNILYHIKMQTSPHTHNVAFYIAFGLIFEVTNLVIIFLSLYLTLWYLWQNYKVIIKSIKVDAK